jgi:hypothetical protein
VEPPQAGRGGANSRCHGHQANDVVKPQLASCSPVDRQNGEPRSRNQADGQLSRSVIGRRPTRAAETVDPEHFADCALPRGMDRSLPFEAQDQHNYHADDTRFARRISMQVAVYELAAARGPRRNGSPNT